MYSEKPTYTGTSESSATACCPLPLARRSCPLNTLRGLVAHSCPCPQADEPTSLEPEDVEWTQTRTTPTLHHQLTSDGSTLETASATLTCSPLPFLQWQNPPRPHTRRGRPLRERSPTPAKLPGTHSPTSSVQTRWPTILVCPSLPLSSTPMTRSGNPISSLPLPNALFSLSHLLPIPNRKTSYSVSLSEKSAFSRSIPQRCA
jgi:hypothetical protein